MAHWTAVISRARGDDPAVRDLERTLAARLGAEFGVDVVSVPHLYDLRAGDEVVEAVRRIPGPLVVLAWLYPRATYWLLRALGIDGRRADGGEVSDVASRAIWPVDLRGACCADTVLDRLTAAGLRPRASTPQPSQARRLGDREPAERWYPVIDYDRCVHCLECLEFCLFGVYDADAAGHLVVADPDRCKPGCPACARVCAQEAIIFPHHPASPPIAGSDTGHIEPLSVETARQDGLGKECADAADRFLACRCNCPTTEACRGNLLDRAIDELDAAATPLDPPPSDAQQG